MNQDQLNNYRKRYKKESDKELILIKKKYFEHSVKHIAAVQELEDRKRQRNEAKK
ncbi:MAG: hypothetical protein ACOC56_00720 [Atribacterota bacterium]